jgi:hypothetical protein
LFLACLEFFQDANADPSAFVRFKFLAHVSSFAEFSDLILMQHTNSEQLARSAAATLGVHLSMPARLVAGQPPVRPRASTAAPLRPIFQLFGALIDGVEEFVPVVASPTHSPLAVAEPALYVSVHMLRLCTKLLIGTNCAALAGVSNAALSNAPFMATNSMLELGHQVGDFLDNLDGLKRHDLDGQPAGARASDLYRLIVHAEVILHWLLGSIAAQVRHVRSYVAMQQRSLRRFIEQQQSAGNVSAVQSAEAVMMTIPSSSAGLSDELDPDTLYQTAIAIALRHSDRKTGLDGVGSVKSHAGSMPSESIVGIAISVFLSRAFEDVFSGLIHEQQDPLFAFCPAQLFAHASASRPDALGEDESTTASPLVTSDDVAALLSWHVCFERSGESAPLTGIQPLVYVLAAAQLARPAIEAFRSSSDPLAVPSPTVASVCALEQRREALAPFIEASRGKTARSLYSTHAQASSPRAMHMHSGATTKNIGAVWAASASASPCPIALPRGRGEGGGAVGERVQYRASPRTLRSMRPVHLLQLALNLAQKLEDSCASAACILHLAMLFFYWIPHYEIAVRLLERLDAECTSLLYHLPPDIGPAYERSTIVLCQQIARDVLRQFRQHRLAGLVTPFFVGTLISLPFPEGAVEGLICPFSVTRLMTLVCQHPTRGIIHTSTAFFDNKAEFVALCANTRVWRDPFTTALSDWPLQMVMGGWFRAMVHEFRLGRYSFARLLADVRAREAFGPT